METSEEAREEGKPVGGCHRSWGESGVGLQVESEQLREVVFPEEPSPCPNP